MFNSFHSSPDGASIASPVLPSGAGNSSESDDVALGWECANPALQIACWGQETLETSLAGGGPA